MSHDGRITIRVLVAGTGATYKIRLSPAELTVGNLKSHLAAAVPLSDQILLLGPPYKVPRDATLQSEEVLNALRLGDMEDDPIPEEQDTTTHNNNNNNTPETQSSSSSAPTTATATTTTRILSTTERSGARRLFLFSRQALSQNAPDPPACHLEPLHVTLPTEAPGPSPLVFNNPDQQQQHQHSSLGSSHYPPPLHQALTAYERQFMLYLAQGRVLADAAQLRWNACRQACLEQAVMARALRAAVSNLSDHSHSATRTRADFTHRFRTQTSHHATLLHRFETLLSQLQSQPLHPALQSVSRACGRPMETLLDTVPVDRERAWANQCQMSHARLQTLFGELDAAFAELSSSAVRDQEAQLDRQAEEKIQTLWQEVETSVKQIRDRQAQRLDRLTTDHGQVVKLITHALSSAAEDDLQQNAFGPLQTMSHSSKDIVPAMIADDQAQIQWTVKVANAKTAAMKRMKERLRSVSVSQSSIQRVLASVSVLKDALTQQDENMVHLEHVAELGSAYHAFLMELRRRRAYGQAVVSVTTAVVERLAALRQEETRAREAFLRGPARHLMPAFFEIFCPTLATPPPLFTPQLPDATVELDTIPNVGPAANDNENPAMTTTTTAQPARRVEDEDAVMASTTTTTGAGGGGNNTSDMAAAAQQQPSNASSLTASSATGIQMPSMEDTTMATTQEQQQQQHEETQAQNQRQDQQQADRLIVSAEEPTTGGGGGGSGRGRGPDLILDDPAVGAASLDAQAKTLAYENAMLRQTLERLGAKVPRSSFVDDTTTAAVAAGVKEDEKMTTTDVSLLQQQHNAELAALRKELAQTKSQLMATQHQQQQQAATTAASAQHNQQGNNNNDAEGKNTKKCDKISHSSFDVGDVGLFMPTGRGSGGKRTYLAFHTSCPHRYLSTDCITGSPDFVLGRIVYQEELVAGEMGTHANPYGLPVGTPFWVLTVEVLKSKV